MDYRKFRGFVKNVHLSIDHEFTLLVQANIHSDKHTEKHTDKQTDKHTTITVWGSALLARNLGYVAVLLSKYYHQETDAASGTVRYKVLEFRTVSEIMGLSEGWHGTKSPGD